MTAPIAGAGLGLRRGLFRQLRTHQHEFEDSVDFLECAPENWIGVGGSFGARFKEYVEKFPIICHGLSLSIGGPTPLNIPYLKQIRDFLNGINARCYTEHLSACSDHGQLYDLMPIPFTEEAVRYVAKRIQTVQDVIERPMGIEHVSYYAAPGQELAEIEFINAVLEEADCQLLLDVNNIYVNSINFGYDPVEFLESLPSERVAYVHIAGHYVEAEDLRIDTHAAAVIDPVWQLLEKAYTCHGVMPTLLERDFNFPPVQNLFKEVEKIRAIQLRIEGQA